MTRITITIESDNLTEEQVRDILKDITKVVDVDQKEHKPNQHGYCACPAGICQPYSWGFGEECGRCGGMMS